MDCGPQKLGLDQVTGQSRDDPHLPPANEVGGNPITRFCGPVTVYYHHIYCKQEILLGVAPILLKATNLTETGICINFGPSSLEFHTIGNSDILCT
jgi:hypothetical protein